MNKNIATCLSLFMLTLLLVGCSDYLERPPYGVQTSENFYKTPEQLSQGLTDAYNSVKRFNFEVALFAFGDIMTDDAEKGGSDVNDHADMYDLALFRAVSSNPMCRGLWSDCYKAIFKCNLVIEKAKTIESLNPAFVKRLVAEAKFLRGLYYFHLATTFGGVPLALTPLSPNELTLERASANATWDQIERDFTDAAAGLPRKSEYPAADMGRATSGAAYSMLAKTLMMRQKYTDAEKALQAVVSSGEYRLVPDFGKIWTKPFENGTESVFEIQHKATKSGWENTEGTVVNVFCMSRKNGGWGFDCPTEDLRKEFEPGDPRLIYTITVTGDIFGGNQKVNNVDSPTGYHSRKVHLGKDEQDWYWSSDQPYNIRYLRYADVLLLYAEVLNENSKPQEALKYLNMVRDRARATNPLDPRRFSQVIPVTVDLPAVTETEKTALRNKIWHERRVELAMEYHRRVDLIRQKRYGSVMRTFGQTWKTTKGASFDDNVHNLCPIPQDEIDRSNGKLVQNTGY